MGMGRKKSDVFVPFTIADFVKMHREKYLNKNGDKPDTISYWQKDFKYPFDKLPQNKPPAIDLCKRIIDDIPIDSRSTNLKFV
jgi:hypothetical protein